jgi:hypothetical protein
MKGVDMRRLVAVLLAGIVGLTLAVALTGCTSSDGTAATAVPASQVPVTNVPPAATVSTTTDVLSPTETVLPYQQVPTATASVPTKVLADLQARQPMLMFIYDPTSLVSNDERIEIDSVMDKYRGMIDLVTLDYTAGLPGVLPSTQTTATKEIQKAALLIADLRVSTTPCVLFVDHYGRVTYRFAGYVDSGLLEREALRATK